MTDPVNFKQVERKIFLSYHEDALIDLMVGFVFFAFGLGILIDIPYLGAISGAVVVPLYMGLKRLITIPRTGYVQMGQKGSTARVVIGLLTLGLLLLALVALYLFNSSSGQGAGFANFMQGFGMSVLGGMVAVMIIGVALYTGLNRFFLHAMLIFIGYASTDWTALPWGAGAAGLIVMLIGLTLLIQFIRRYPVEGHENG